MKYIVNQATEAGNNLEQYLLIFSPAPAFEATLLKSLVTIIMHKYMIYPNRLKKEYTCTSQEVLY